MMNMKKVIPLVLLGVLLIWGAIDLFKDDNPIDNSNTGTNVGDVAPNFELKTVDGEKVRLSDFKGKKVIINFWATWCPPCKAEIPDLISFYEDYEDDDVVILGINITQTEASESTVQGFVYNRGISYPVLLDTKGDVTRLYKVSGYPTSYFIDSDGIIRKRIVASMSYDTIENIINYIN